jgi:hypothetical protein
LLVLETAWSRTTPGGRMAKNSIGASAAIDQYDDGDEVHLNR